MSLFCLIECNLLKQCCNRNFSFNFITQLLFVQSCSKPANFHKHWNLELFIVVALHNNMNPSIDQFLINLAQLWSLEISNRKNITRDHQFQLKTIKRRINVNKSYAVRWPDRPFSVTINTSIMRIIIWRLSPIMVTNRRWKLKTRRLLGIVARRGAAQYSSTLTSIYINI